MKKQRQMNIELFRIVTMLMIVMIHFLVHGGVVNAVEPFSFRYYILWTLCGICYVAVNGYVLISGYFLYDSQFKLKKLLILLGQTFFYSVIIFVLLCKKSVIEPSLENLSVALLPTINSVYWFITIYVGMYILSPFLNWALKRIDKKQHLLLIIVLIILFSVWPTFAFLSPGLNFGGSFGIAWFLVLYCIGAYIRKFYVIKKKTLKLWLCYVVLALAVPMSKFIIIKFSQKTSSNFIPDDMFFAYNSVLVLAASVLLFLTFLNMEIKNKISSKIISFLSPATLGVYLIHDNRLARTWIWEQLKVDTYVQDKDFMLYMLGMILAIYLGCTIIEKIRIFVFRKINNSLWLDKGCKRIESFCVKVYEKIDE